MYTPHTVTLINVVENDDFSTDYVATVLKGVFLDTTNAGNVANNGANSNASVSLFVPFSVDAHSLTGRRKAFLPPRAFRGCDTSSFWTLSSHGESSAVPCFFVKGIVEGISDYNEMREKYDFVYDVASVRTLDFGSPDMQHWQVMGK